ncbi:hypothetical protein ACP275_11G097500 [Erythranthe tilingii]
MDAQAKKKALFRAKLNAQKQQKQRIDSPLVRYNEHDQPVCRICDVVIKSDSLWPAHQASRKHHEAIEKLKSNAAALNQPNSAKPESAKKELPNPKPESSRETNGKLEPSTLPTHQSSTLPPDFFDNHESKKQKIGTDTDRSSTGTSSQMRNPEAQASKATTVLEAKQVKGALPQGFFDDKDADLRAHGITPVKPDVKDEYKEFEKLIQEDLKEVDNRLEEEEFDAAEMIEEEETVEQKSYVERVEMLRRKKLELRASRTSATGSKDSRVLVQKESIDKDSSSDDEVEDFKVDWRAKHL